MWLQVFVLPLFLIKKMTKSLQKGLLTFRARDWHSMRKQLKSNLFSSLKEKNIVYMNILITPYIPNYFKAAVPGGWGEIIVRYHSKGINRLK